MTGANPATPLARALIGRGKPLIRLLDSYGLGYIQKPRQQCEAAGHSIGVECCSRPDQNRAPGRTHDHG